jgi:hypothetical protein
MPDQLCVEPGDWVCRQRPVDRFELAQVGAVGFEQVAVFGRANVAVVDHGEAADHDVFQTDSILAHGTSALSCHTRGFVPSNYNGGNIR